MAFRDLPYAVWFRDEYMSEVAQQVYGEGNGFVRQIHKAVGEEEFVVVFRVPSRDLYIRVTSPYFDTLLEDDDLESYVGVEQATADAMARGGFALVYREASEAPI